MKILITRVYNTFNIGSAMMAINLIYNMNKYNKNIEFFTDIKDEENLKRLKLECKTESIYMDNSKFAHNSFFDKAKNKIIYSYMSRKNELYFNKNHVLKYESYAKEVESKYDAVIILGGDDLSGEYPIKGIVNQMILINELSNRLPVFLFGHTLGPFNEKITQKFLPIFKRVYIYTRDKKTEDYLNTVLKGENVKKISDLAFLGLPCKVKSFDNLKNKYEIKNGKYITIIPSGLYRYYTEDKTLYVNQWQSIIINILENKDYSDYNIILLSHVFKPDSVNDSYIIDEIYNNIENIYKDRIIKITDEGILPHEAREILGNGELTISGRMHGAVSTFAKGKPAIAISYSVKYNGVIGMDLGFKELVVNGLGDKLWKEGTVKEQVIDKINYVFKNKEYIIEKINERIEFLKYNVQDGINDIIKQVEKL